VRVVPSDLAHLDGLARFLERLGCKVEKAADSLEVFILSVPEEKVEDVLGLFLANWRAGRRRSASGACLVHFTPPEGCPTTCPTMTATLAAAARPPAVDGTVSTRASEDSFTGA
jgi:hypothetical protein